MPALKSIPLTHVFTHFQQLGGVEALLRRHLEHDALANLPSRVVALFDPPKAPEDRVLGGGWTWKTSPASGRVRFHALQSATDGRVAVYHNCWGASFLADLDGASRRLGLHHSDWPGVEHVVRAQATRLDGVLCVGPAVHEIVDRELPGIDSDRRVILPLPISPPPSPIPIRTPLGRPLVIGVCGRVITQQKRVDQLPEFCAELRSADVQFQLEILGDGPDRIQLERQFDGRPEIVFHGRKSGLEYWKILDAWDVIFFASEYEGLPLALLEAMSRGVVPVYPSIGSSGDRYVTGVRPDLLYPAGRLPAAARVLRELQKLDAFGWGCLREASSRLALPHAGGAYDSAFSEFVRRIVSLPRISEPRPLPVGGLGAYLPFGILGRLPAGNFLRRGLV